MGYEIKHILTINENSSRELLEKIAQTIEDVSEFNFTVYDDHLDDSNWNFGGGISGLWDWSVWQRVSEEHPDVEFTVHCYAKDTQSIYQFHCYNGYADEWVIRHPAEWYEKNKDGYEKNPGVRPGYFTDYGLGDDYPVPYGDGHIPAGVDWTKLVENNIDLNK